MTLIECLDPQPIRNMAGCLQLRPEKLIFLGREEDLRVHVPQYQEFLDNREQKTEVFAAEVDMNDRADIESTLRYILKAEKDCVIDVTGGAEELLLAVGAVSASCGDRLTLHKADLSAASITVSELIHLHGGTIHPKTRQPNMEAKAGDLQPIWALSVSDPKEWNRRVGILNAFESRSEDKENIELRIRDLEQSIPDFHQKEFVVRNLVDMLSQAGVVEDRSSFGYIRYRYNDPLIHESVKKAGNLLEMKTLLEARAVRDGDRAYFDAALMSVTIDWDGIVHESRKKVAETRNEVDVVLTRGMTPLFISCKNGSVDENELYKLNTVAERFGSGYAKKMLIVSRLDMGNEIANEAFARRAEDMGVYLVKNAADLSSRQWKQVLKEAMEKVW